MKKIQLFALFAALIIPSCAFAQTRYNFVPNVTVVQYGSGSNGYGGGSLSPAGYNSGAGTQGSLTQIENVNGLMNRLSSIGNTIIGILISLAVVFIIYSAVMSIIKGGGEAATEHKKAVMWGIIGLAIILSIWGIVRVLTNTFNTGQNIAPTNEFPNANFFQK